MAKFRVEMVDGRTYEVEAPEGTPQETLLAAIQQRDPFALKSTEALEAAPSAPFKAADIGRAAKAGIAGGLQSLTDIFGAGNVASQYLEEAQKAAYQGMSPERIEEMQRREELKKRAEGKGLGKEISSYLGGFAEAPLQTAVQALAGSAPIIASTALPGGPAAGIARLLSAARGPTAVGAAMGLGGQKGQDYETVKQALLEQGVPEPEAERRAQEASAYSMQNILRQAGAAAAGAAEGRFGVEPAIGKLLTRRTATGAIKPPTWDVAIGQSILGEAAPEALQAAVGQLGTNQALNQAGIPTEITKGLAGTVAHDALVGAVLGFGLSPAQKANMARDYEATQREEARKRQEEERARIAEIERKQQEEYEKAGYAAVQKPLAPADLTKNPLGSFTVEELQPEVVAYIDNYRNQMGLPKIQQYSVEDIADAMPGLDKKREREALGEIVGKKAGYTPEATVSVQNVLDQALAKNIDIEGKGFTDFLARTTGVSDFKEMTDPQLFAAYKAISALPDSPTVREMEAGTNAVRFDDTQYNAGLKALDATLEGLKRPVSVAAAVDEIKFASGLRSDKAANALLEEAIRRGDLDETQTPRFEVVRPSTGEILGRRYDTAEEAEKAKPEGAEVRQVAERQIAPPTKVAALPEGYDIQEGLLKTGEAPQAFDVKAGDQILSRVKSEEEAQAKLNSYSQTRAAEAANAQKVIERQQKRVADSAQRLNAMEAGGKGRTAAYQNMAAKHARLIDEVNKIIARQTDRIKKFDPSITPITISPVGAKAVGRTGFTVLKEGVPLATLPTREAAERAVLGDLTTGRLEELAQKRERRGLGPKAAEEIERRAGRLKPEKSPEVEALEQNLRKVLDKFGLKDVALEVAEAIAGGKAGGSYLNSVIKVALDEKNPVRTLRHESLHALRDLGFFSDKQWNALTNQARSKWIDTYLKQRNIDGQPIKAGEMSRYDAYVRAYKGDIDAIVEEAIADAFADFDATKAPPGMLSALLNKLRSFFEALRNALSGAGFQTAEDVFGKVERAELTPTKKAEAEEKLSLRIMRGEEEPKFEGKVTVDKVGKYFDDQIKATFKRQLDYNNPEDFARAIDEAGKEVAYQLEREKSGLDWYEEDIKRAFTDTIKIIPELKKEENRILFTVMAGIMSPQTNARDNWFIAAKGFQHYLKTGTIPGVNPDTGGLWQGGTTSANKKVALEFLDRLVNQLGKKKAIEWIMNDHTVKEINEYRAKYGLLKSGIDGKMGDIKPGLYAFGPKVGPFVSNINGIHDVTVDMWMTRTFNRYFGTMIGPDGKIVDAPTEPQRKAIKDLVNKVAQNANIKPYQVQSVLWFYEQSLFSKLGTPAPSYGFSDGAAKFVDDARGGGGEKGVAVAPKKAERLSIRQNRELFKKAEQIPMSEGVEVIRDNWIGGVSGVGDRDGAYDLYRVDGGPEYTAAVQDFIRTNLGDNFKGYRLMSQEELEELRTGSMGSQFVSFTLNPDVAKAFKNLPRYAKRSDLVVVEMDLTPEHVNMIGHPGEEELVVDYGQGYDPDAVKVAEGQEKFSLRAPQTPEFKQWFGNSKIVDENGEPKVMYHGTGKDYEILGTTRRQAKAIFVTDDPVFAEKFAVDTLARAASEAARGVNISDEMYKAGVDAAVAAVRKDYGRRPEGKEMIAGIRAGYDKASPEAQEYMTNAFKELLPAGPNIIPMYVKAENPFDYDNPEHINALREYEKANRYTDRSISGSIGAVAQGYWEEIERRVVQDAIKSLGHDSFYVKEGGKKSLAVYESNQLKSAFNQRPTERPELRLSIRASIDPSLMAMVDRTTHQRDEKTFIQSITEAIAPKSWSHFRQQALNRYNRLSEADKIRAEKMGGKYLMADASAESAALMSDLAAGVSASALGVHDRNGGIPVYRNGITTVWNDNGNIKGPTAIFAPLAKYNDPAVYQLYQFWAGAKRGRRLLAEGKERLYTQAEITRANELLQQFPEFESIQQEWIKYNNGLMEYAVATGVLSRERADEFMRYSDYVPFYRQLDGESSVGPKIFQAISGVKPPKKIKGGEQPLDDFLETVVRNTQSIIQSGMKNVAAQRAAQLAVDIGLGERLPKKASGPDIVTILENGQEVSYAVADPLFIEAVKSLNLPDLPFIGLLSGPANLLRNLVTKDPGFMLANMMRDSMAAWVTSGVNMTPVSSTVINFTQAFAGKSPEFQALLNAGVIGGYEFSQNVIEGAKTLEKSLGKAAGVRPSGLGAAARPFTSLWETLEKGTTASDAATRMEVYKQVLAETGNEAEALYRALEVMNFNRKGSSAVVRILTAAVPFLNARMQGLDVLYRAAFGQMATKDAAAIQRAFFVRGMTIAAISCMYWALTHDDDEYKKQEEETKDNNWLVPSLGVKIPIPFEVGVLFKVIPERIMAYTFGDDTGQDFLKSMGRNLAATLMINPIPQTALPVVEATTNFSFFTMRPIVGQGMEDVAPQFQVGPSTSIIAEEIGGALGISPMKLDHMIKGYTGTMGMYMVDLIDSILNVNRDSPRPAARFEQLPVIKRFALDPEARGNVTAYYDLKNSVDQAVRTTNYLERSQNFDAYGPYMEENMGMLATRDYVLDLEKTMKEFREMKTLIRASDMSSTDKRDSLIEVNRMEDQLTKNIREIRALARQ